MKRYAVTVVFEVSYNNDTPPTEIEDHIQYNYIRQSALNEWYKETAIVVSIDEVEV